MRATCGEGLYPPSEQSPPLKAARHPYRFEDPMRTVLLLCALAMACAPQHDQAKAPDGDSPSVSVGESHTPESAIRTYEQAMVVNDTAAVAALWDAGPGADTATRTSQLKKMMVPGTDRVDSFTAVSGPDVKMIGDSATASGKVGLYGKENDKDFYATANYTYSLRKQGAAWKITAAMFVPD